MCITVCACATCVTGSGFAKPKNCEMSGGRIRWESKEFCLLSYFKPDEDVGHPLPLAFFFLSTFIAVMYKHSLFLVFFWLPPSLWLPFCLGTVILTETTKNFTTLMTWTVFSMSSCDFTFDVQLFKAHVAIAFRHRPFSLFQEAVSGCGAAFWATTMRRPKKERDKTRRPSNNSSIRIATVVLMEGFLLPFCDTKW